jgi:hypothetical protein
VSQLPQVSWRPVFGTETDQLELALFEKRPEAVRRALAAGLSSFLVDMEWRGKEARQLDSDTEINRDVPDDAKSLRSLGAPRVWCRLDRLGPWTTEEIEAAIDAGVDLLFLPMVERPREVEAVLRSIDGRAPLAILVETPGAVDAVGEIAMLPLAAVYLGLNDLSIARRTPLFAALADGTVDQVREAMGDIPFGVAGVTSLAGGRPLASHLLLAEIARLDCRFTFLRRSFRRDVLDPEGVDAAHEVATIRAAWADLRRRDAEAIARDRLRFLAALDEHGLR